jgi:hypothetical protein
MHSRLILHRRAAVCRIIQHKMNVHPGDMPVSGIRDGVRHMRWRDAHPQVSRLTQRPAGAASAFRCGCLRAFKLNTDDVASRNGAKKLRKSGIQYFA